MTVPFGSILLKNSVASTAPGLPVSLTSAFDFERIVAVKRSEPNCGKQDFAGGQAQNLAPEFFNRIGQEQTFLLQPGSFDLTSIVTCATSSCADDASSNDFQQRASLPVTLTASATAGGRCRHVALASLGRIPMP